MYISVKELSHLEMQINKLQDIIELQNDEQNRYFPESISTAREMANKAENIIKKVTEREIKSKAKKIIRHFLKSSEGHSSKRRLVEGSPDFPQTGSRRK